MKDLFERTEFLLNGGVLTLLSDSLAAHAARGVILRPEGEDLTVLEAFGAGVESLFLKGRARDIQNAFPSPFLREAYDVAAAPLPGEWPWGIRLRGRDWVFFILLSEEPPKELIDHMPSFAGLLSLWQKHQKTAGTEERLSKLAYMVLATKSTLASVFEPMGLDYFGAFLCDVLTESLFPSRLSVVLDKGGRLSHLDGEDIQMPPRKGIFARDILSPVPVRLEESMRDSIGEAVFHDLAGEWSAILPIIGGDVRLFCLLRWETLPGEEALNFMELLGNVASKALSMSAMREEKERNMQELSRRAFLLNALHEAALKFLEQTSKEELLLQILDIFSEMTQAPRAVLVAWQPHAAAATELAEAWRAATRSDREYALARAAHSAAQPRREQAAALWRPSVGLVGSVGLATNESEARGARFSAPAFGRSTGVGFDTSVTDGTSSRWALAATQPLYAPRR